MPLALLALVSALFEKKKRYAKKKTSKLSTVGTLLVTAVIVSLVMLVSCQFRFGAIVVATESMTGEINKGDVIVYERYEKQTINEGQVIVFLQGGNRIVHRVVKIEQKDGEVRYFTKGDANNVIDSGYVTDKDIVGLTDIKVAYIGYPTLWLRELLDGNK
jgi:signal peptidase I